MTAPGGSNTVSFALKAIADLKGVTDTAKALGTLGKDGEAAGKDIGDGMNAAQRGLTGVQGKADAAAKSLKGIALASAGILGVGVALFKIGSEFDSATDKIRVATGATGAALDGLANDAKAVFSQVPNSLDDVATAVGELSTRTGDSGKALQDLAKAELNLADITGTDLKGNIEATAKVFEQWGIATDQQVPTLDKLFRASQATGVGIDRLAQELTQFGPILQTMGFGLDDSIALLSGLDKAGVDASAVIQGMRVAVANFSSSGVKDMGAALRGLFDQIKNAKDDTEATTIAIQTFGTRAGPALAQNIRDGRLSVEQLEQTISHGSDTIDKATRDTQDFAEKFKILKNNVVIAVEPLGTQLFNALNSLIPAMRVVGQALQFVGDAFGKIPGPIQGVISGGIVLIGVIAGISVAASAVAGVFATATGAVASLATVTGLLGPASAEAAAGIAAEGAAAAVASGEVSALAASEAAADVAAGGLLASLGSLAAMAGAGIAIAAAVTLTLDFGGSLLHGGSSWIDQIAAEIGRLIAAAFSAVHLQPAADALNAKIDEAMTGLSVQDKAISLGFHIDTKGFANAGDAVITEIGVTVKEAQQEAAAAGLTLDQYLQQYAAVLGITKQGTQASLDDANAKALAAKAAANGLTVQEQQIKDAIDAKKTQDDFNKSVQETLNKQFLAGASADGLYLPFTRDAEDAQKATEEFNQTLDGITDSALNAERGLADMSSELPGLQTGFGKVGESVVDVFRHMDDLGVVNLSPMARGALDAISTLDKVEAKIKGVEGAIQQNQGDLNMWAGRISLVESVFGASTQTISEWVDELQNGQITQEQFNAAVTSLGQGGFPKLDALLQQNKISQREYNEAKEAGIWLLQRSAGGMQDEDAQLVQNIIDLANYAKAHDDADGAVKGLTDKQREFVAAMGDSKTQTFLQTLQLLVYLATVGQIPASKVTKFIADSSAADPVLQGVIADLGLLDDGTTVPIDGDSTGYKTTAQGVKDDKIPDKVVTITTVQQSQISTGAGFAPFPDATVSDLTIPPPPPIPITSEDKTANGINAAETSLSQFGTDAAANAGAAGTATGNAFSDGLAAGLQRSTAIAGASAAGILGALSSVANGVYNYGFNGGYNFGIGVANGIAATWNAVFNAAFNVGYAAYLGNQAGMQAHSPSKLGLKGGANWGQSVAMGIASTASDVLQAGKALGASLAGVISAPDLSPAMRAAALSADSRPRGDLLAGDRGGNISHRSTVVNLTNNFHGITDTGEIIDRVNTQTYQALTRAQAAGAFGS